MGWQVAYILGLALQLGLKSATSRCVPKGSGASDRAFGSTHLPDA